MEVRQLVKKAKRGDKEALLKLILEQKDEYYKLAYTYTGNKVDAMDAMEDMIVKLYEKIQQLKKVDSFYSWSKTILVNCCHGIQRNNKKVILVEDLVDAPLANEKIQNPFTLSEQKMDIQNLLSMLNPNQAEAIRLRYFQDLDYQSIANLTNTSLGTVKSRIHQGLARMKKIYGGGQNE